MIVDRVNSGLNVILNDYGFIFEDLFFVVGVLICIVGFIGNFVVFFVFLI